MRNEKDLRRRGVAESWAPEDVLLVPLVSLEIALEMLLLSLSEIGLRGRSLEMLLLSLSEIAGRRGRSLPEHNAIIIITTTINDEKYVIEKSIKYKANEK